MWFKYPTWTPFSFSIQTHSETVTKKSLKNFHPVFDFFNFLWYLLSMGTKDIFERTLPVYPSQKQELNDQLDWFVFTTDKFQKPINHAK